MNNSNNFYASLTFRQNWFPVHALHQNSSILAMDDNSGVHRLRDGGRFPSGFNVPGCAVWERKNALGTDMRRCQKVLDRINRDETRRIHDNRTRSRRAIRSRAETERRCVRHYDFFFKGCFWRLSFLVFAFIYSDDPTIWLQTLFNDNSKDKNVPHICLVF